MARVEEVCGEMFWYVLLDLVGRGFRIRRGGEQKGLWLLRAGEGVAVSGDDVVGLGFLVALYRSMFEERYLVRLRNETRTVK